MTKFNPENKKSLSYGEALKPAMEITEQEDADQYFADYVKWVEENFKDIKHPKTLCKVNLNYFAGYYGTETSQRVSRLFNKIS